MYEYTFNGRVDALGVNAVHARVPLLELPLEWVPGEPDNYLNSESCLVMLTQSNGTVGDLMCSDVFPYVCYKKKSTLVN
ncbi:C-type lectin 21 [Operophtera brumata]|uniref:C-type lectin 21 n=1 Tax=Operophtera brumata TaxID=104452 RepID=A0A0L7KRF7_OPEBR|nr:C-type lectin 21 [Operophtera brumata]